MSRKWVSTVPLIVAFVVYEFADWYKTPALVEHYPAYIARLSMDISGWQDIAALIIGIYAVLGAYHLSESVD